MVASFQNCGGFEATSISQNSVLNSVSCEQGSADCFNLNPNFGVLSINETFLSDQPMIFYPNPDQFPRYEDPNYAVEFSYDFTWDGDGQCSFFHQPTGRIRFEILCTGEGTVRLFQRAQIPLSSEEVFLVEVQVVRGNESQSALDLTKEIPDWDTLPPTAETPVVRPPAPPSPPPTQFNGAELYRVHCAACHYPLATSEKMGRNFTQIDNAIRNNPQMRNIATLRALSEGEVRAIADALAR